MKLKFVTRLISQSAKVLLCLVAVLSTTACEDSIYDSDGNCSILPVKYKYELAFTQTRNFPYGADIFSSSVKSLSVFLFDEEGQLVATKTEEGEALAVNGYTMEFDVAPGIYDVIAWGGLQEGDAWELAHGDNPLRKEDLICSLQYTHDAEGNALSQRQLNDLFHASERVEFPEAKGDSLVYSTTDSVVYVKYRVQKNIDMTKNNNTIRIVLQHYNGKEMNADDFHFAVADANGVMNYDNTLLESETISYREYSKKAAVVEIPAEGGQEDLDDQDTTDEQTRGSSGTITSISSVVAEIDMGRLMANHNPILTIEVNSKGDVPVLKLPLVNLLLEARRSYEPQDFLDCQDDYTLIFYLDDAYGWYTKGGVWVNDWHVIYNDHDL